MFNVAADEYGYFEPEAGYLRPEACIAAQLAVAEERGATICRNELVQGFDASADGVAVTTDRGHYLADRLVLTAGAWLPTLVGARIARHFTIYRQRLLWLAVDGDPVPFSPDRFPVFIWELQRRSQGIYGFPALDGPRGGVKIGVEQFATETTADADEGALPPNDIAAFHAEMIEPFLSGLAARCVKTMTCLYTVTPDFGFVIDAHPDSDRVLLVAACSGHGFKHSPAIGEAAARWADEGRPPFAIDAFSLARLEFAADGLASGLPRA